MKRYITILGIAVLSAGAKAQDLSTEITVDRTVQPVLREMTRISGITPTIPAPEVKAITLNAAEYTDPGEIANEISILPAASWSDSIEHSPNRGYMSLGYFPIYNLEGNLGYRIVDKPRFGLGMWGQYNGNAYNGDIPYYDDALFTNHNATIGGNMAIRFTPKSVFTGNGYATWKSIRSPYYFTDNGNEFRRSYNQDVRDIMGNGKWQSQTGDLVYSINGTLGYFTLGSQRPQEIRTSKVPVKQAMAKAGISIGCTDGTSSQPWIGINADYMVLRTRDMAYIANGFSTLYRTENLMLGNVNPFITFDNSAGLVAHLGGRFSFGSGYNAVKRITPDVMVSWKPTRFFTLYAKADGGEYINQMNQVMEINPFVDPSMAYGFTTIPLIARGGLNIGPYDGMELGIYGGYAMARDILSPLITINRNGLMVSTFEMYDVNSWHIGAHVGFEYQSYFRLDFDIKYGQGDRDTHSWCEWMDAPKVVSDVNIKITPIDPLEINIGYEMRYDRKARSIVYPYNEVSSVVYIGKPNLGTVNDVTLKGAYKINKQLTGFLVIENLLNNKYKLISGMPAQGINGLLGAAYKF